MSVTARLSAQRTPVTGAGMTSITSYKPVVTCTTSLFFSRRVPCGDFMTITTTILDRASALKSKLVDIRRTIHANPELSFKETETCKLIESTLKEFGYKTSIVAGTGVIAEIGSGKTVVLRADIDALPIQERNDHPYCSRNANVMHACGHDIHTTCLLGAAKLIADNPPKQGRIRFMFQPGEETINEDGKAGATLMMEAGAIKDAEAIFALHCDPRLQAGKISVRDGAFLAACDTFNITISGRATHGAYPEYGIDAIVLASQVVQAMQAIISRRKSALEPAVLTIGGIRSKTYRPNIVADTVEITGTIRYFGKPMQDLLLSEIKNACSIAETLGGSYKIDVHHNTVTLMNDPELTNLVRDVAGNILGKDSVVEANKEMGSEDFSFLSQALPACYFLLGVKVDDVQRQIHTPLFDANEAAIPVGASMLAESAMRYLAS